MKIYELPKDRVYYLAGPMSGRPDFNYPAFKRAETELRTFELTVISPATLTLTEQTENSWSQCLRHALRKLLDADAIIMLDEWECSTGARLERKIAAILGMRVFYWSQLR